MDWDGEVENCSGRKCFVRQPICEADGRSAEIPIWGWRLTGWRGVRGVRGGNRHKWRGTARVYHLRDARALARPGSGERETRRPESCEMSLKLPKWFASNIASDSEVARPAS